MFQENKSEQVVMEQEMLSYVWLREKQRIVEAAESRRDLSTWSMPSPHPSSKCRHDSAIKESVYPLEKDCTSIMVESMRKSGICESGLCSDEQESCQDSVKLNHGIRLRNCNVFVDDSASDFVKIYGSSIHSSD
ncbi:hypothetical protein Y032_0011g1334 [Ancylostoma ceylanicum]|uniref:Uncharacterized protein n=1 Tax=Ancylostoma ceylanicum TaxID=53326 RepID=A0A016VDG2_9BILA|nr:hypothetical protein Y032_0011g1334 [Ancylostoma ceylanicum]